MDERIETPQPHRRRDRAPRWLVIVVAATALSLALTAAAVRGEYNLGPGRIEISLRPALHGVTVVSVPPFGSVEARTHRTPAALVMSPTSVDVYSAQVLIESRPSRQDLVEDLRADLEAALKQYVWLLLLGGLVAGLLAAAIVRARSFRDMLLAVAAGVVAPVGLYAATFVSYDTGAFGQPTLTGAIGRSPELLGPVQQFGERFNALRSELDEIGSITFQLYQYLAEQSPIPADAVRILHISDLHLNPVGYDVARLVARRFNVAAVIDSGDVTAEGTQVELAFVDRVAGFTVPYIFVRGNHDSMATQAAVGAHANARVLDGELTSVQGLMIFGVGDPLYTPDKTRPQPTNEQQREAKLEFARIVEDQVRDLEDPPHVVVVHDALIADRLAGRVPLVIHGHEHRWSAREREGTQFLGAASTGAAGLKSLAPESDGALALQVLYFDPRDFSLLGYDRIEVRGQRQQFLLRRTIVAPEALEEPLEPGEPDEAAEPAGPAGPAESPGPPAPGAEPGAPDPPPAP